MRHQVLIKFLLTKKESRQMSLRTFYPAQKFHFPTKRCKKKQIKADISLNNKVSLLDATFWFYISYRVLYTTFLFYSQDNKCFFYPKYKPLNLCSKTREQYFELCSFLCMHTSNLMQPLPSEVFAGLRKIFGKFQEIQTDYK